MWLLGALLSLRVATPALAQVDLQKYEIYKLVLKYVTDKPSTNRCLLWFPFKDVYSPVTEFDEDGRPFTRAQLRARVRGKDCNVSYKPQEMMRLVKQEKNDLYFEVIVRPPVTVIEFNGFYNGPDFRDQLIFEAQSDALAELDFFTFFRKSKVFFEARDARLTTTNTKIFDGTVNLAPVFGGKIGVPFPWVPGLVADFSMFQNLGNLTPNKDIRAQYSEYSFGLSYLWSGREVWGRPQIQGGFDFRGRNLYQTYFTQTSKPLLIGSAIMPGIGLETSWFPGGSFLPWEDSLSRWGFELAYKYSFLGKIPVSKDGAILYRPLQASILEMGLQFRLSRKWSIGGGYSIISQSMQYPRETVEAGQALDFHVKESLKNYYIRLVLTPYIVEGAD
jgi:hypothetical protein